MTTRIGAVSGYNTVQNRSIGVQPASSLSSGALSTTAMPSTSYRSPQTQGARERLIEYVKDKNASASFTGNSALASSALSRIRAGGSDLERMRVLRGGNSKEAAIADARAKALELYKAFGPGHTVTTQFDEDGNLETDDDETTSRILGGGSLGAMLSANPGLLGAYGSMGAAGSMLSGSYGRTPYAGAPAASGAQQPAPSGIGSAAWF